MLPAGRSRGDNRFVIILRTVQAGCSASGALGVGAMSERLRQANLSTRDARGFGLHPHGLH